MKYIATIVIINYCIVIYCYHFIPIIKINKNINVEMRLSEVSDEQKLLKTSKENDRYKVIQVIKKEKRSVYEQTIVI